MDQWLGCGLPVAIDPTVNNSDVAARAPVVTFPGDDVSEWGISSGGASVDPPGQDS